MPITASTGTDQVSTAGKTRRTRKTEDKAPEVTGPEPQPLADHSGNGIIQVSRPDGTQVMVNGDDPDLKARIEAIRSGEKDH